VPSRVRLLTGSRRWASPRKRSGIADASGRSVGRWLRGEVVPQKLNKQPLIELAYVAELVTEVLPAERVNLWMLTPNRLLEHDSPAERIRSGGYRDVLGVIEAIADGVVV